MKKIPDLGFWKLWNISFGFFGVQIAYASDGVSPICLQELWLLSASCACSLMQVVSE